MPFLCSISGTNPEDEMAGWHHRLDGREFESIPGVGDGQGGLACCDSWGCKESDIVEVLPAAVLVGNPLALAPRVIEVNHRRHGIDAQAVNVVLLKPEQCIADEK